MTISDEPPSQIAPVGHGESPVIEDRVQYDTNLDDIDPRLIPHALAALLAAGADDAWATPIVMKKGRPGFTLSALCRADVAAAVREVMFAETPTLGIRETVIRRYALGRRMGAVEVGGHRIGVKVGLDADGRVLNRSVEWDDVVAAAAALGEPAKQILAAAEVAAEALAVSDPGNEPAC